MTGIVSLGSPVLIVIAWHVYAVARGHVACSYEKVSGKWGKVHKRKKMDVNHHVQELSSTAACIIKNK